MSTERAELVGALQAIPWFQELSQEHFEKLAAIAQLRELELGEELFREGDPEDLLYVVLNGRVAIEIYVPGRGRTRVFTAQPMEVVGWSSVTPVVRQRTASARAVLPSRLAGFEAAAVRRVCDEDHHLGYLIMRRLANVVAGRLLVTRLQLMDMFAPPAAEEPT